ncbi:trypsin-like peptidase domain-containing protein [Chloroflexota bacterium]
MKRYGWLMAIIVAIMLVTGGCTSQAPAVTPPEATPSPSVPAEIMPVTPSPGLAGLEQTLQDIYEKVTPSVVNIRVLQKEEDISSTFPQIPGFPFFDLPIPEQPEEQYRHGAGSGFIWDREGHIVTNNHVIIDADRISVTFHDGTSVSGELVGSDADSDLAIVKVDVPAEQLQPVQMADSSQVKVGLLAVAIGNPFGQKGTMTVGFVSALGRLLPADTGDSRRPKYSIPDIIQTDAAINPGNSGGVLVDRDGRVIGVTTAILSPVQASVGIGFAIPSAIVNKVVPSLITTGYFEHPWLGISGISMGPELAEAMDMEASQRGALVIDVVPDSPADKGGLRGSDRQVTIDGEKMRVGGDVITAIDGQPVKEFGDLVTYLARATGVGQTVTLSLLHQGEEIEATVTLTTRPGMKKDPEIIVQETSSAWLGIMGLTLGPEITDAMGLPTEQKGVLVEQVYSGSPADEAGLRGSYKPITVDGRRILVGGDVIAAIEDQQVNRIEDLQTTLQKFKPGQRVKLTILRNGSRFEIEVTLGESP